MMTLALRGDWGPDEFCPFGAYATAIELKVDLIQHDDEMLLVTMMDLVHHQGFN